MKNINKKNWAASICAAMGTTWIVLIYFILTIKPIVWDVWTILQFLALVGICASNFIAAYLVNSLKLEVET